MNITETFSVPASLRNTDYWTHSYLLACKNIELELNKSGAYTIEPNKSVAYSGKSPESVGSARSVMHNGIPITIYHYTSRANTSDTIDTYELSVEYTTL